MSTSAPTSSSGGSHRRRRRIAVVGSVVFLALVVFVLVYFQPQKLFIDDRVEDAAPAGAVPLVVAPDPSVLPSEPVPTTASVVPSSTSTAPDEVTTPSAPPSTTVPPSTVPPTTAAPQPITSTFISLDHGTSGTVLFLEDPVTGDRYLRFESLDTDNGPDLKVYLSTNPAGGPEQAFDDDFVDLGRLQGNQGDQNYEVPADVDLTRYASVVIWCDRFDSAFGAADLAA